MPGLTDKLRMMEFTAKQKQAQQPQKPAPMDCYHNASSFPLSSFSSLRHMNATILKQIFNLDFPRDLKPEDLLFLDTETTGLSGGAGTVAFEVGLGYISHDRFVVEQFLMRDYPEEPIMLQNVARLVAAFPTLVTFNGRTFDAPLLETRFLMNRMMDAHLPALHADMLPASRRVWKVRLGRCTLQRLENEVLGVEREDDLPGADVPQTYFKYLHNGDFYPIERILQHNQQDVVSLAQLFFFLCRLYDKPETAAEPDDLLSLAKTLNRRGETVKAKKCYRIAASAGRRAEAYGALAAQEKREGNMLRAVKLYTAMLMRNENPVAACEGLAKLYEHQLGNAEQAMVYTRQSLLLLSEPRLKDDEAVQTRRNALQYRYARLRHRLANDNYLQEDKP
jgi:uncharacterized protein